MCELCRRDAVRALESLPARAQDLLLEGMDTAINAARNDAEQLQENLAACQRNADRTKRRVADVLTRARNFVAQNNGAAVVAALDEIAGVFT